MRACASIGMFDCVRSINEQENVGLTRTGIYFQQKNVASYTRCKTKASASMLMKY